MDKIQGLLLGAPVASFIFLVTLATSLVVFQRKDLFERFELRPYSVVHQKRYFTILTSALIHANWQHLFFNMLTYYFFAFELERFFVMRQVLSMEVYSDEAQLFSEIMGRSKFFVLYLGSMIIAVLTTIVKYKDVPSYKAVGASGALSGVVIAFVLIAPSMGQNIMIFGILPGWIFAIGYILVSYFAARNRPNSGIAHEAHLWGTIAGIVLTVAMYPYECWKFVESVAAWTGRFI